MAYVRKTRDVWCIETYFGGEWNIESTYDTKKEAYEDLPGYREYTAGYGTCARVKKHRERIKDES